MTDREDSSEGFLGRWSRKKIDAEREAADAPIAPGATDVPPTDAAGLPAPAKNEIKAPAEAAPKPEFDLASLPSLDSITAATDIRAFLSPGVPKELARAALRRAWSADPAIRDFKGLAENDWDFTDPAAMPGFGALPPGYDVKKLVAQIFSGSEKQADPDATAEKPADQQPPQIAPQAPQIAEKIEPPGALAEAAASSAGERESDAPETSPDQAALVQSEIVQRDNNVATHNSIPDEATAEPKHRRPHGGALPQ